MRCESFLDRLDRLDAGEEPGILLRLHLAGCPSCRAKVAGFDAALDSYNAFSETALDADEEAAVEYRVMAAVRLLPRPRKELHARDWYITGIVIVASMALIPFDSNFGILRAFFGESLTLPLFLVLGLALTIYGAVFIGTHMTELEPLLHKRLPTRLP